jgi:fatty acid desaturase
MPKKQTKELKKTGFRLLDTFLFVAVLAMFVYSIYKIFAILGLLAF